MLRRGGCEGRGRDESIRSEQASGVGVGGGRVGETRWGDAGRRVGEARSPLRQAGQFQPMGEPAAQILRKSARFEPDETIELQFTIEVTIEPDETKLQSSLMKH